MKKRLKNYEIKIFNHSDFETVCQTTSIMKTILEKVEEFKKDIDMNGELCIFI